MGGVNGVNWRWAFLIFSLHIQKLLPKILILEIHFYGLSLNLIENIQHKKPEEKNVPQIRLEILAYENLNVYVITFHLFTLTVHESRHLHNNTFLSGLFLTLYWTYFSPLWVISKHLLLYQVKRSSKCAYKDIINPPFDLPKPLAKCNISQVDLGSLQEGNLSIEWLQGRKAGCLSPYLPAVSSWLINLVLFSDNPFFGLLCPLLPSLLNLITREGLTLSKCYS